MNPTLLKFVGFIRKRPSDKTISLMRIITWLIIICVIYFARNIYELDIPFYGEHLNAQTEVYIEYGLLLFGVWCIALGLFKNACLFKKEIFTKMQIAFWVILILLGGPIMDPDTRAITESAWPEINSEESVAVTTLWWEVESVGWTDLTLGWATASMKPAHNPSWILVILGLLPIALGLTGKWIPSTCLRYGQKVNKVRV